MMIYLKRSNVTGEEQRRATHGRAKSIFYKITVDITAYVINSGLYEKF